MQCLQLLSIFESITSHSFKDDYDVTNCRLFDRQCLPAKHSLDLAFAGDMPENGSHRPQKRTTSALVQSAPADNESSDRRNDSR